MRIFYDILFRPERTMSAPDIDNRLNWVVAVFVAALVSAPAMYWVLQIGNVEGGNPAMWYIIGALLDLELVKGLSTEGKWALLYPVKLAGDAGLIIVPGYIAYRRWGVTRDLLARWAKAYCYTMASIDLFWLAALQPAIWLGNEGRPLLVTNLLAFMVMGANIVVFTNVYRCSLRLEYEQSLFGWFVCGVAIPALIIACGLLLVE